MDRRRYVTYLSHIPVLRVVSHGYESILAALPSHLPGPSSPPPPFFFNVHPREWIDDGSQDGLRNERVKVEREGRRGDAERKRGGEGDGGCE